MHNHYLQFSVVVFLYTSIWQFPLSFPQQICFLSHFSNSWAMLLIVVVLVRCTKFSLSYSITLLLLSTFVCFKNFIDMDLYTYISKQNSLQTNVYKITVWKELVGKNNLRGQLGNIHLTTHVWLFSESKYFVQSNLKTENFFPKKTIASPLPLQVKWMFP